MVDKNFFWKNNAKKGLKWAKRAKIGLNLPKKITLKTKKVDKGEGGGGARRWIKKNLNVITLTLMAVDKGGGVKPLSTKGG